MTTLPSRGSGPGMGVGGHDDRGQWGWWPTGPGQAPCVWRDGELWAGAGFGQLRVPRGVGGSRRTRCGEGIPG